MSCDNCGKMNPKHPDLLHEILNEYDRQAKGGAITSQTKLLSSMVTGKLAATNAAGKAEIRKQLLEVCASALKTLESL